MKVLLAHNFYQSSSPSGEDAVYNQEAGMLRKGGVEIIRYERHNDEIKTPLHAAFGAVWSRKTYHEISALIRKERPDIAHFHNIWYLISPSAYYACKDAGVPVVQTLHNFRMFCASGLLLRNGRVCEECIGKIPWRGAAYGCFRSSRLYSTPVVFSGMIHQMKGTWADQIDAYIALTDFGRQKFVECGLPAEKIYVKPNFLPELPNLPTSSQDYAVFIGRLSEEKGIDVLFDAIQILTSSHPHTFSSSNPLNFKIVGDGPLLEKAKGRGREAKGIEIEFVGRKNHDECMELLRGARFLVLPSVCYENFPMTIVEAFACGKPVIASRLGAMAAIVEHEKTGLLFNAGDSKDLADKIQWMIDNPDACSEMGENARAEFDAKYTAARNHEILMDIYEKILTGTFSHLPFANVSVESIMGYSITTNAANECVATIVDWVKTGQDCKYFVCANPHSLETARKDPDFDLAIQKADLVVPDGIGMIMASKILGGRIRVRVTGTDIFLGFSEALNKEERRRYFFLGSTEQNLVKIKEKMKLDFPNIVVAGLYSPPFKTDFTEDENDRMVNTINQAKTDVLWVGMTAPKQEKWIHQNKHRLNVKFIGAIGAVFDFYTGNVKRSQPFFQKLGLEWLPRLLQEPRRLWYRNFVSNPSFLLRVIRHKLKI